jgi:FdhD protein
MDVIRMDRSSGREQDFLAREEPLQIRLGDRDVAVSMRTPGNDDELAAGFLFTQGILHAREDIAQIACGEKCVTVTLGCTEIPDLTGCDRPPQSSHNVCGEALLDSLVAAGCAAPPRTHPMVNASIILRLPETLRGSRPFFDCSGGLHGAALFDVYGNPQLVREDVGRHNCVDKLVGRSLLDARIPLNDSVLLISGWASFGVVQKALMSGIPVLAAPGAPSTLAVDAAVRFGVTLVGFVGNGGIKVYSGEARLSPIV